MRMLPLSFMFFAMSVFVMPVLAQEETGMLIYEGTFDEYEDPGWWTGAIESFGAVDDFDIHDSPFWEMYVAGGTVNDWDEQMGVDWDTPEDGPTTVWRVQYRVRVTEYAPYNVPTSLQINQEPWTGPATTHTIPEAFLGKWIFFDFLMGPEAAFDPNVAPQMGLRFRFGGQQEQFVQLDDIRVYQSNAVGGNEFEGRIRGLNAVGATVEGLEMEGAPEGVQVLRMTATEPGTDIEDVAVLVARIMASLDYTGAYRMNFTMRSNVAPLNIQAGVLESTDVANAKRTVVDDTYTLTEKDTWTEVSFLLPPRENPASRRIQPFLQFGGQGNAVVDIDRLFVLTTDEEVEVPVDVRDWQLF